MNRAVKAKWVKALRSDRYKQAKGTLRTPNGRMCCLGVLCHIQGIDWKDAKSQMGRKTYDRR